MKASVYVMMALLCVAVWCSVVAGQGEDTKPEATEPAGNGDGAGNPSVAEDTNEGKEEADDMEDDSKAATAASPSVGPVEKEAKIEGKEVMSDDDDDDDEVEEEEEDEDDNVENEEVADAEPSSTNNKENGAALLSVSLPSLVVATVLAKVYAH